jgi:hypothetical protein
MAQRPRVPDLDAQREAMKKVSFLVGKWSGESRVLRGPGEWAELLQTEEAQGVGRTKSDDQPVLQAFGIISYDDECGTYHLRAFNDGRFLETTMKLLEQGNGMSWGFALGEIRTNTVLRINERSEWTEAGEISIGSQPAKKFWDLTVQRQR